jgi:hypothetical protein
VDSPKLAIIVPKSEFDAMRTANTGVTKEGYVLHKTACIEVGEPEARDRARPAARWYLTRRGGQAIRRRARVRIAASNQYDPQKVSKAKRAHANLLKGA